MNRSTRARALISRLPGPHGTAMSYSAFSGTTGPGAIFKNSGPAGLSRRVFVKVAFTSVSSASKSDNAHRVAYIGRTDRTQTEAKAEWDFSTEEKPVFTIENGIPKYLSIRDATALLGDSSTLRFIISPQDRGCDLVSLVSRFTSEILPMRLSASKVTVIAAIHSNTFKGKEIPQNGEGAMHAHLIVSRRMGRGQELTWSKSWIKNATGLRHDLSFLAESLMGPRRTPTLRRAAINEASRLSLIEADETLSSLATLEDGKSHAVIQSSLLSEIVSSSERAFLHLRLSYLSRLTELVKKDDKDNFYLDPLWRDRLIIGDEMRELNENEVKETLLSAKRKRASMKKTSKTRALPLSQKIDNKENLTL